ncbi:MAG: TIGR03936 family radical SAM-associated protein [Fusicatenibacter sp.]|nr:TIGR03936 family radical SAM-associated protein [Lachnospiraceae bacterium]MDY2938572.1 TIGR03936 family radical SAM-associated protein [Fusicatenibacter sp.]
MKIRIKFAKEGVMKFVGHLDIMRYFQKAIRRAQLPIAYSEGFSPHMLLSFASPLGVGITSTGEYFDMVLKEEMPTKEIVDRLNQAIVEGMHVISARRVPDGKAGKAMSLVSAADYLIRFREECVPEWNYREKIEEFSQMPEILVMRKTKRSEKMTDIRPWIYKLEAAKDGIFMQLSAGSVSNLKPELVMEAFFSWAGKELSPYAILIHREEVYADIGEEGNPTLVPLEALGEEVE